MSKEDLNMFKKNREQDIETASFEDNVFQIQKSKVESKFERIAESTETNQDDPAAALIKEGEKLL